MTVWMQESDLITVTEVTNNARAAALHGAGWAYFNAKKDNGSDQCAIAWDKGYLVKKKTQVTQLENVRYQTLTHHNSPMVYAAAVLLQQKVSGDHLLVSVTHFPAHVQGQGQFGPSGGQTAAEWRARKLAYTTAMKNWSSTVKAQMKAWKPHAVLCVADWNLDLKEKWVRQYIGDHWKNTSMQLAWRDFPTNGTSVDGGNRIIDGSLYTGMQLEVKPVIMPNVRSSDHRPYKETFLLSKGNSDPMDFDKAGSKPGDPWWGFGDYEIDELFFDPQKDFAAGERGGEVL